MELLSLHSKDVSLLIGASVPEVFIQLEVKKGNPGQRMAVNTPLEWILFGYSNKNKRGGSHSINMVNVQNDHDSVTKIIKGFGETEEVWNSNERGTGMSQVDKKCLKKFCTKIKHPNGRYTVPML